MEVMMKIYDLIKMSFSSLKRTKLRTILTTSGVIIGIGALISMVSFGTGIQKNISDVMAKMEVFSYIQVLPKKMSIDDLMTHPDNVKSVADSIGVGKPITDSTITQLAAFPDVSIVYPDIFFSAKLKLGSREAMGTVQAVPFDVKDLPQFNELTSGSFFSSDSAREAIVAIDFLKRLKINKPDSAIGLTVDLITAKIDFSKFSFGFGAMPNLNLSQPFGEELTQFKIVGVWKKREFTSDFIRSIIIPLKTSKKIEHLDFNNVFDLLSKLKSETPSYASLRVKVKNIQNVEAIQKKIEDLGYGTLTIATQIAEMRKGFLFMDAALGTIGTIALIVAALGIINTMVMSVLERYSEIGVMKAIGATDGEIKLLFFFESSAIGILGGALGLVLGWLVTRLANTIGNHYIVKMGGSRMELFYIPWWLILGGILFAVGVSLLAGIYPASRAAKVDPVKALRHE
jgi:ABC-type antimicrobial peptide transport system permease subunit